MAHFEVEYNRYRVKGLKNYKMGTQLKWMNVLGFNNMKNMKEPSAFGKHLSNISSE